LHYGSGYPPHRLLAPHPILVSHKPEEIIGKLREVEIDRRGVRVDLVEDNITNAEKSEAGRPACG